MNTLADLRAATSSAHEDLDAAFGSLSLSDREGLQQFLIAHAIGMAPLFPVFSPFVEKCLAMPCPDFPGMLNEDLRALEVDPALLPSLPVPQPFSDQGGAVGVAYVVCGSRLGLEAIRRAGYWNDNGIFSSRYMEDDLGRACWKALVPWLRTTHFTSPERKAACASALASFETFARAFAVSSSEKKDDGG